MDKSVTYLGLVVTAVTVGGPQGPEVHSPASDCPIAAFALPGWKANDTADEALGQKMVRDMEAVGKARADGDITAVEFGELVARLELPGGKVFDLTLPIAEEVARRLQDDGQLSRADQLAIGRAALGQLARLILG